MQPVSESPLQNPKWGSYAVVQKFYLDALNQGLDQSVARQVINQKIGTYMAAFIWYTAGLRNVWGLPRDEPRELLSGSLFAMIKICDIKLESGTYESNKSFLDMTLARMRKKFPMPENLQGIEFLIDKINDFSNSDPQLHALIGEVFEVGQIDNNCATIADYIAARQKIGRACGELVYHASVNPEEHSQRDKQISMSLGSLGNVLDSFFDWHDDRRLGITDFKPLERYRLLMPAASDALKVFSKVRVAAVPSLLGMTTTYLGHHVREVLRKHGLCGPRFNTDRTHPALQAYLT
jgi:hypothetical protein